MLVQQKQRTKMFIAEKIALRMTEDEVAWQYKERAK